MRKPYLTRWTAACSAVLAGALLLLGVNLAQAAGESPQKVKAIDEQDARMGGRSIVPAPAGQVEIAAAPGDPDAPDALCPSTVLPTDTSTSGNGRAPSVRYRSIKTVYLISAAELAAAGFPNGSSPSGIGWHYTTAPGVAGSGTLVVFLQNTADTVFSKSTNFPTAITGMTTVHNAATALPNSTTPFDIAFSGGSPFTYTGGGLYVAFQWTYAVGTLSTTAVVACNTAAATGLESSQSTTATPASDTLLASAFRPETRLTVSINNDVSVDYVLTLGEAPNGGLVAPQTIRAIVTNHGSVRTNVPVQLSISGAEVFTDTQVIPTLAQCGGQTTVSFASWNPSALGSDSISVSVPADDTNANNNVTKPFALTVNRYNYKHPGTTAVVGGVGFTGGTGEFVSKFTVTSATQVDSALLEFMTGGGTYRVVVYADSGSGTPGAQIYVDGANRTSAIGLTTARLASPVAVGPGNFYVGIQQLTTTNIGYSFDAEVPVRAGSFYFATTFNTGPWTDLSPGNNFKLNMGVILGSCLVPLTNDVTPDSASVCAGNAIVFTSTPTGGTGTKTYQWTENGSDIAGQTGTSTSVTKGAPGSFNYNAKVTDDGGCVNVIDAVDSVGTWVGNGGACDDGNVCTGPDTCTGSVCAGPNPCDDGDACTNDICGASCTYTAVNCDDSNPCTDDSCNPATGCVHANNTAACSDGNPCTVGDVCGGGACVPGGPASTVPVRVCNNSAITIPAVGNATPYPSVITVAGAQSFLCKVTVELNGITHVFPDDIDILLARPSGTNAIIMSDVGGATSVTGVSVTLDDAAATSIPDAGPLTAGTFKPSNVNPGTGTENWPAPAPVPSGGSALSAFNGANPNGAWNLFVVDDESPDAGSLTGWCVNLTTVCGSDTECDDANVCTADSCFNSVCVHTPVNNACNDNNACTSGDTCSGGVCVGGPPPTCDDGDGCTVDSCNPATGLCEHPPTICNDNNTCTDDACVSPGGCVFTNNDANACTDQNACTQTDSCVNGACVGSNPVVCDDGQVCTTDTCNTTTGGCVFTNNTGACDDGDACTTGDVCAPRLAESFDGVTAPALPAGWTSSQTGTGSLWVTSAASSDSAPNSAFGADGATVSDEVLVSPLIVINSASAKLSFRTRWSFETATTCFDAGVLEISIGGGAFTDIVTAGGSFASGGYTGIVSAGFSNPLGGRNAWCNLSTGYPSYLTVNVNLPAAAAGQTIQLRWRIGTDTSTGAPGQNVDSIVILDPTNTCTPGSPVNCDDGDACTADSCNPGSGCVHTAIVCDDSDACTADSCDPGTGCVYTPITAPPEVSGVVVAADKTTYSWSAALYATRYDVVRGSIPALPVGPGGGDEVCFDDLAGASLNDASIPPVGNGFWYLSRGENSCGLGTWGDATAGPRVTTTCP